MKDFQLPPIPGPRVQLPVEFVKPGMALYLPDSVPGVVTWMVLHAHPDDPGCVLLVPVDTLTWEGPGDIGIPAEPGSPPYTVRTGSSFWLPLGYLKDHGRLVMEFPEDVVQAARQCMLAMVRGTRHITDDQYRTSCDPDYEQWRISLNSAISDLQDAASSY